MTLKQIIPIGAFGIVLALHAFWFETTQSSGAWASVPTDQEAAVMSSYVEKDVWLGLSYAAAAAFGAWCLLRLREYRKRALAGTAGGVALTGILYAAGCFLLGCCGSPMLPVYLGLFGPQFLGFTGPLTFGITLTSVGVGVVCMTRRTKAGCGCEQGAVCNDSAENTLTGTPAASADQASGQRTAKKPVSAEKVLEHNLKQAANTEKCWGCGCAYLLADTVERQLALENRSESLNEALRDLQQRLQKTETDCRGCSQCYGANGVNAL